MATDYPDWGGLAELQTFLTGLNLASASFQATANQISNAIAAAGVPLLHGADQVSIVGLSVPAGTTKTVYVPFAKPGYIGNVKPIYTSASGSTPFMRIAFRWADANPLTDDIGGQEWTVPVSASGSYNPFSIAGPTRGPFMRLDATNLDSTDDMTLNGKIWETTQHIARDDWRLLSTLTPQPVPGYTYVPGADMSENVLASLNQSPVANTTYMLPLYSGQAYVSALFSAGSGNAQFQITDYDLGHPIYTSPLAGATEVVVNQEAVTLPRKPCLLELAPGLSASNFQMTITAMEFAS